MGNIDDSLDSEGLLGGEVGDVSRDLTVGNGVLDVGGDCKIRARKVDDLDALLHLAGGTIGGALKLLTDKGGKGSELSAQVLSFWTAVAERQIREVYLATASLPSDRERMSRFIAESRLALRDMAAARYGAGYESLFGYEQEIKLLSAKLPLRRILLLDNLLVTLAADLAANANLNNVKVALADGCRQVC